MAPRIPPPLPEELLRAVLRALDLEEELRRDGDDDVRRRRRILISTRRALSSWADGDLSAEDAAAAVDRFVADERTPTTPGS
jgi:hypothetical protein